MSDEKGAHPGHDKVDKATRNETYSNFPPIERWWPALSIQAKHQLLEDLEAEISDLVVHEIEAETASRVSPTNRRLSEADCAYIRTQIEIVD